MSGKTTPRAAERRDHHPRNVQPKGHDPYKARAKEADATVCDDCGVVHHGGRWYWDAPPLCDERGGLCPACQRIRDGHPAGTVHFTELPEKHRAEILGLIRNTEEREKREHPLERLMQTVEDGDDLIVTTTGMHLARCIAGALQRRFHGGVQVRYADEENLVRVEWGG